MHITSKMQVSDLIKFFNSCIGGVKLVSKYGDVYNLRSDLSQYVAIARLIENHNNDLSIVFDDDVDELNFCKLFRKYPEMA